MRFTAKATILFVIILSLILVASTTAQNVPTSMNFQGLLTDAGGVPVADDSYSVEFTIYDASSGGSSVWTETQSVTTTSGLFTVLLGSVSPIGPTVFNTPDRYLGIKVGTDPELSPRTRLVTVPYAYSADNAATLSGEEPSYFLDWSNLTSVPADIADGDDVLTEATVDAFVSDNPVDWNNLTNVPADIADGDDVLTEATVDAFVSDNPVEWNNLTNVPAGFADGVDDVGGSTLGVPIIWSGGCSSHGRTAGWNVYCSDVVDFNTASAYLSNNTAGVFTVLVDGYYRMNAWANYLPTNPNSSMKVVVNGSIIYITQDSGPNSSWSTITADLIWPLNAGDQVQVEYYVQTSAGYAFHSYNGSSGFSRLQISYEGPLGP